MMSKMNIAIYPYIDECSVFSDNVDMLSDKYAFSEAASPRSWGFSGQKITTSFGEDTIKMSPSEFKKENDILLIPDIKLVAGAEKGIVREIVAYIPLVKKVFYCGNMTKMSKEKIVEACNINGCEFEDIKNSKDNEKLEIYYQNLRRYIDSSRHQKNVKTLSPCSVPIVAVSGEWESTDKFPIQLKLLRSLRKNGYKVSMIGSNVLSIFFGVHKFPSIMTDTEISEFDKPNLMSRYIYNISEEEKPDIFIIGVPGSAQAYNSIETNNFGILPYITFQAMEVDYLIFTTLYREGASEVLKELTNMCYYKYGIAPDTIHMTNVELNQSEFYNDTIVINHVKRELVDVLIDVEYSDNPLIENLMNDDVIQDITERIICKLSSTSVAI